MTRAFLHPATFLAAAAAGRPDPAADGWARGFWLSCALFLLFRFWRGWQDGLARQLLAGVALVAAYAAGWLGGPALVPGLRPYLSAPDFVLSAVAGVGLGTVTYFLINAAARTLFARTGDRAPGAGRLLWGVGGAAVAVLLGLVSLWVVCIGVRLAGAVAEGHAQAEAPAARRSRSSAAAAEFPPPVSAPPAPTPTPAADSPLEGTLRGLARVKGALDQGVVGEVMAAVDPVPASAYATLNKLARVVSDPAALDRFRNNFTVRQLGADPKLAALLEDPTISRELASKNYRALLSHPRVLAAANDPQLARRLRTFDLGKALDEALGEK